MIFLFLFDPFLKDVNLKLQEFKLFIYFFVVTGKHIETIKYIIYFVI